MRLKIEIRTGNGSNSTEEEVRKTRERLMAIAGEIRGSVVDGKGFSDGAMIEIEDL